MEVFNNRDIASVLSRHLEHVEDILHLSMVCKITQSQAWSQRMSEPYYMAARIRHRFGFLVAAEDAFTQFRAMVAKGTWCLGGCGQEKEYFVPPQLTGLRLCCDLCFYARVTDQRIHAFEWKDDTRVPIHVMSAIANYVEKIVFFKLAAMVEHDELERFIGSQSIDQLSSHQFLFFMMNKLAVSVGGEKWIVSESLYGEIKKCLDSLDLEDRYYRWSGGSGRKKKVEFII